MNQEPQCDTLCLRSACNKLQRKNAFNASFIALPSVGAAHAAAGARSHVGHAVIKGCNTLAISNSNNNMVHTVQELYHYAKITLRTNCELQKKNFGAVRKCA